MYGTINSILTKLDNQKKMPFAFICYSDAMEATKAIEALNDTPLVEGNEMKLSVCFFEKKEERKAKFKQ